MCWSPRRGCCWLSSLPSHATAQIGVAPHVGFNLAAEEFFFSTAFQFKIRAAGIGESGIIASPGFDYYPSYEGPSDVVDATGNTWVVNLDLLYPFQARDVAPYVGGGFYIARSTFRAVGLEARDTQVGLNLKEEYDSGEQDRCCRFRKAPS